MTVPVHIVGSINNCQMATEAIVYGSPNANGMNGAGIARAVALVVLEL